MFPSIFRSVAAGFLLAGAAPVRAFAGNALTALDAYLAQAALTTPAYRADLQAGAPGKTPPGRLSGVAPFLGPFTYRPKTFGELTAPERAALLRDPPFRAFVIATREESGRGGRTAAAGFGAPPRIASIAIGARDLLAPGPLFISVPPP